MKTKILWAGAAMLLVALAATPLVAKTPAYIAAAVADKDRPEADTQRDKYYKPAEVMEFAGVKPGMKIADFLAWDGYYSRLFSKIAGPKGYVYTYYPTQEDSAAVKAGANPGAELGSYSNVGVIHAPAEKFVTPEKVDLVWTGLSYHDMHLGSFKGMNVADVDKAIFATLKPGGTFIVLDRASKPGAGLNDLALARIDEAAVKSEVESAGFKLVGESNILHNPSDDYSMRVTKPQYAKNPDEFLLKFRKP